MDKASEKIVSVIGCGLIGQNFAILFSSAGYSVKLYDVSPEQLGSVIVKIAEKLADLKLSGNLRGTSSIEERLGLLHATNSIERCLSGAVYVQECVPENIAIKKSIHVEIGKYVDPRAVIASSTSTLLASSFTSELPHRQQILVAHPINPPLFCPLVEVVPSPWTDDCTVTGAMETMKDIGQSPVLLKKEVAGFVVNRLQYSLLNECLRLIESDVISVDDLDKCMTEGLGMRYAFIGPLETCHLNADGIKSYINRYGVVINEVSATIGGAVNWQDPNIAEKLATALEKKVPLEKLEDRRCWRDQQLSALTKLKISDNPNK